MWSGPPHELDVLHRPAAQQRKRRWRHLIPELTGCASTYHRQASALALEVLGAMNCVCAAACAVGACECASASAPSTDCWAPLWSAISKGARFAERQSP
eukprot:1971598-Pyramimonas_sp.AAC.1